MSEEKNWTIYIGTNKITDPVIPEDPSSAWEGNYVYYGTYAGNPVKYRVLAANTEDFSADNSTATMLLDCDRILKKTIFNSNNSIWNQSQLYVWLNGKDGFLSEENFTAPELAAIAESTKQERSSADGSGWSNLNYTALTGEKVFLLDAAEAANSSYGYSNTDHEANNRKKDGAAADWWLRSSEAVYDYNAVIVYPDGCIYLFDVKNEVGVSPALNIKLSSVLFSSPADDSTTNGKSAPLTRDSSRLALNEPVSEWKLTLLDKNKTIKITEGRVPEASPDGTITIPYTCTEQAAATDREKINQISIMITDKDYTEPKASILYYGALSPVLPVNGTTASGTIMISGIGTFTLPAGLSGKRQNKDYYIYIIAEHINKNVGQTDYAGIPCLIKACP